MGIFDKMFGKKESGEAAAGPSGVDFVSALSMHVRGEVDQALAAYQKLAEGDSEDTLAAFFAAAVNAGMGNTAGAAETLRGLSRRISAGGQTISQAVSQDLVALLTEDHHLTFPAVAEIIVSLGSLLKGEGFVQESAVCFEIAVGLVPTQADVLHKLGDTLHDLRMYEYAESVLREALRFAPNHWDSLYTYAVLLQDLGRDEEAITYYEKAVRFNPDHARCHNNFGAALMRVNRLEEALEECSRAAELDPGSPFVKLNLGNICLLRQEYGRARDCFSEAISLNGNIPAAYFGLASAERMLGTDPARAREAYLKAIELNPSIAEFHHAFANFLASHGNEEAFGHYSAAEQFNGSLQNLHKDFGSACLQMGRREEGVAHLRVALQQNPADATVKEMLEKEDGETPE